MQHNTRPRVSYTSVCVCVCVLCVCMCTGVGVPSEHSRHAAVKQEQQGGYQGAPALTEVRSFPPTNTNANRVYITPLVSYVCVAAGACGRGDPRERSQGHSVMHAPLRVQFWPLVGQCIPSTNCTIGTLPSADVDDCLAVPVRIRRWQEADGGRESRGVAVFPFNTGP